MAQVPEQGNIRLIIFREFHLEIPGSIPPLLCNRPRKYLRYLGWCILGVEGRVAMNHPRPEVNIGDEGPLEDQGIYRYDYSSDEVPAGLSFFICTWIITL
jgi:hypothetical protein